MALLPVVGLGVGVHAEVTRIEWLDDPSDRATLAAGIGALHHHEEPGADSPSPIWPPRVQSELQESLLCRCQSLLVLVARELRRQVDVIESSHALTDVRRV